MTANTNSKLAARAKAVKILKKIPVFEGLKGDEYHRVMAMCSSFSG